MKILSKESLFQEKCSSANALYNPILQNKVFHDLFDSITIHVVAPASGTSPEKIAQLQLLFGLTIEISPTIINQDILFHATGDEERFEQLKKAFYNQSKKRVIWTLRGGYGSARLIDKLSVLPKPECEKIFIGFSDNTALHLFLSQQWGWQTIHASGFAQLLDKNQDPQNYMRIAEIVANTAKTHSISHLQPLNSKAMTVKPIKGYLTGGNLTIVETSIGTRWQAQTADKIVFLEEVGEKGYRIDRSLNHLSQAGLFKDVTAIVFGAFTHKTDAKEINIALERFATENDIPIYKTDQFGHAEVNYPLIYNTMAEIIPLNHEEYELKMNSRNT